MITVKRLKELLKDLPDDAKCYGYSGEESGLGIRSSSDSYKTWWIRASEDFNIQDTHTEGFEAQPVVEDPKELRFMEVSFVEADIRSQWQANFSQIFPITYNTTLPETDPSDEAFFNEHWKGEKEWWGIPLTYKNFMLIHYPGFRKDKLVVAKKSGKPFKSGQKTATVKSIILNPVINEPAYTFLEDASFVNICQCVEVPNG